MIFGDVRLLCITTSENKYPDHAIPEFAFIGRSNVGKSSLLNMLLGSCKIARVSKTPGKTRALYFYSVENRYCFVDMPGYGFAKRSQKEQQKYMHIITHYIRSRKNMLWLFLLIDSRHKPLKNDISFLDQLNKWKIPTAIVFTKTDKLSNNTKNNNINYYLNFFNTLYEDLPPIFVTSSVSYHGREEMLKFIEEQAIYYTPELQKLKNK